VRRAEAQRARLRRGWDLVEIVGHAAHPRGGPGLQAPVRQVTILGALAY
jgi:hypothetical protein